ncbi:MAG: NAD-dependent epimerase/dehydratase family protein [Thermogutta sp.]
MMHRALITGITGFVGRHLCAHLLEWGDQVIGLAPYPVVEDWAWGALPKPGQILFWDLETSLSPNDVKAQIRTFQPTIVYHLAGLSVPDECGDVEPNQKAWKINVEGTLHIIELLREVSPHARLIFVSTSHVYRVPQDRVTFVSEDYPVTPRNGYAQTKLAAEQIVQSAIEKQDLDAVIVRAFPHTGPGQPERMMLPSWIAQFVRGDQVIRVHTLKATIDLSDVRDVVRAYRLLADSGLRGEVYHVGSGIPRTSGDVFNFLQTVASRDCEVVEIYPGVKYDPVADLRKIRDRANWKPEIPLETTVSDTYQWWLSRGR